MFDVKRLMTLFVLCSSSYALCSNHSPSMLDEDDDLVIISTSRTPLQKTQTPPAIIIHAAAALYPHVPLRPQTPFDTSVSNQIQSPVSKMDIQSHTEIALPELPPRISYDSSFEASSSLRHALDPEIVEYIQPDITPKASIVAPMPKNDINSENCSEQEKKKCFSCPPCRIQ